MSTWSGIRNRWASWRLMNRATLNRRGRPYPNCQHTTGVESCCCGTHGWRKTCGKRISIVRFVLIGTCPNHKSGTEEQAGGARG